MEKTKTTTGWNTSSEPQRIQGNTKMVPGFVLSAYGVEYDGLDSVEVSSCLNRWSKQLTRLPVICHRMSTGAYRQTLRWVHGYEGTTSAPTLVFKCSASVLAVSATARQRLRIKG